MLSLWYSDYALVAFFLISKVFQKVRKKMIIIIYFGDGTRRGSFFIIVSDEDH